MVQMPQMMSPAEMRSAKGQWRERGMSASAEQAGDKFVKLRLQGCATSALGLQPQALTLLGVNCLIILWRARHSILHLQHMKDGTAVVNGAHASVWTGGDTGSTGVAQ
jgi:hypothetical protein